MTRLRGKNSRDEYLVGPLYTAAPARNTDIQAEPRCRCWVVVSGEPSLGRSEHGDSDLDGSGISAGGH